MPTLPLPHQVFKVGAENACRRFLDSAAAPGVLDNCMLLDGINGPLTLSKTKWPEAIWDMNVQGSQWAALAMNSMEQVRARGGGHYRRSFGAVFFRPCCPTSLRATFVAIDVERLSVDL